MKKEEIKVEETNVEETEVSEMKVSFKEKVTNFVDKHEKVFGTIKKVVLGALAVGVGGVIGYKVATNGMTEIKLDPLSDDAVPCLTEGDGESTVVDTGDSGCDEI